MKTMQQLKDVIDFQQTDKFFIEYLGKLQQRNIITLGEKTIVKDNGVYMISDDFFRKISFLFGVQLDDDLNVITNDIEG